MPRIHFLPDNKTVETSGDESIREAALRANVPIAHVCEGKGRCSTCRVVILDGIDNCSARTPEEQVIADQLGFGPEIRLACQTMVLGDIQVRRLTLDEHDIDLTSKFIMGENAYLAGVEKYVFIMFVDIRDFTSFTESLLPYDVIHILHRFFHVMNDVIVKYGGYIDNYLGDGFMALFEVTKPEEGALSSIKAGLEILNVQRIHTQPYIEKLFGKSFTVGIGLHYGLVVAGTVGGGENKKTTVVGDAVNFASRIEAANKQMDTEFLISEDTFKKVSHFIEIGRMPQVEIVGKSEKQTLYEVISLKQKQ